MYKTYINTIFCTRYSNKHLSVVVKKLNIMIKECNSYFKDYG